MAYLELRHVTKRFGSVTANDDVSLSVEKGHIHALLGENGAGKSTLMNILYGLYAPTEGEVWLDGKKLDIRDSKQAIAAGIGMVHQHFMLIPALTVIENVMLGYKEISKFKLRLNEAAKRLTELAEKFLKFMVSPGFQNAIPTGNWMYPVTQVALPPGFDALMKPQTTLEFTPQQVAAERQNWINAWQRAVSR